MPEEPIAESPESPDPEAGQQTQVLPPLPESALFGGDSIALPEPEPSAAAEPVQPATVSAGSRLVLIVSRGASALPPSVPVSMPDVTGETQGAALLELQNLGLAVEVLHDRSRRLPRGYVIGQYPMAGGSVLPGTDAVLLVSSGRPQLPAPDVMLPMVVGLVQTPAVAAVSSAGLIPRVVYDHHPVAVPGTVLAQIPSDESLAVPLRKRGGKAWLVAVAVLGLVAGAAGAVWFLNRPMPVPNLMGLSQQQAEQSVRRSGFRVGSVSASQTPDVADIGRVVGQAPSPGGTAPHGSDVSLRVGGGQLLVVVPNVAGWSQSMAANTIRDVGLSYQASSSYDSEVPSGSVVSQAPVAGQRVPSGTTVGLTVSMGAQTVTVPSVTGQVRATAEVALVSSGLSVQVASNYDSSTPSGLVIAQSPTVGTGVVPGTIIGLTVSRGVPATGTATSIVPAVVGKTSRKAKAAIKAVGLKAVAVSRTRTGLKKGQVVAELPDQGAILPKGSVVILFVSNGK